MEEKIKQQNCGIYKIENLINGKVYIGQSINISKRWSVHKFHGTHTTNNSHLYLSMRHYGINNFSFEVIEYCPIESLNEREQYWIQFYNSTDREKGYNIRAGGNQGGAYYDYSPIYQEWLKGTLCKDIAKKFNCSNDAVTNALRFYGVSSYNTYSQAQNQNKKKIVALTEDYKPLKIFDGAKDACRFLRLKEKEADNLLSMIRKGWMFEGYRWEILNEFNTPSIEISEEEFLAQKKAKQKEYTTQEKIEQSYKMRTVERPSREELKYLIRNLPFTKIGKMYGVSDNSVRKWCDFENLPRKKRDINSYSDEEWEKI